MNNLVVAIDTEYNSKREILSLGLFSPNTKKEIFFNQSVDSFTLKIHGIPAFFLEDKNKYSKDICKDIFDYTYVLGFDIYSDLEVLQVDKINKKYSEYKVIDLKNVLSALSINKSLSKLSMELNICDLKHSSYTDSKSTYLIFEHIYSFFKQRYSFSEFCSLSAKLTESFLLGNSCEKDNLIYEFSFLESVSLFNIKEKNVKAIFNNQKYIYNNYAYIFKNGYLESRFPSIYLSNKSDFEIVDNINSELDKFIGIKFDLDYIKDRNIVSL